MFFVLVFGSTHVFLFFIAAYCPLLLTWIHKCTQKGGWESQVMDLKDITLQNTVQVLLLVPWSKILNAICQLVSARWHDRILQNFCFLLIWIPFMSLKICALLWASFIHSIKTRMSQFFRGLSRNVECAQKMGDQMHWIKVKQEISK